MTPDQEVDEALDAILKVIGSSVWRYKTNKYAKKELDAMRAAMRKIMSDSYIKGSNDCLEAD